MEKIAEEVRKGLLSKPKYFPSWYRFDRKGSALFAESLKDQRYYRPIAEAETLRRNVPGLLCHMKKQVSLLDLGSGDAVMTQNIIDAILKKQPTLIYYPVDISSEFLQETCIRLKSHYGDRLVIKPVPGFYSDSFSILSELTETTFIIYFNSILTEAIEDQVNLLQGLSKHMKDSDCLLVSADICSNRQTIEECFGPSGPHADLYMNDLHRLNKEFADGTIDSSKFSLRLDFVQGDGSLQSSYAKPYLLSLCKQSIHLGGQGISVHLEEGEEINLSHWGGISHKYIIEHFSDIAKEGNQTVFQVWKDAKETVAVFCLHAVRN